MGNCELHHVRLSVANFEANGTQPICIRISGKSCKERTVPWKVWRKPELCSRSNSWHSSPPLLPWLRPRQQLPEQGSNFPSKGLLMENVISGTRSYFLISFFLPTSDFIFFPTSFVQVWISMGYNRQTQCQSHSSGTLHPVDKLWKNITKAREEKQHGQRVHNIKAMVFLLTLSIML